MIREHKRGYAFQRGKVMWAYPLATYMWSMSIDDSCLIERRSCLIVGTGKSLSTDARSLIVSQLPSRIPPTARPG